MNLIQSTEVRGQVTPLFTHIQLNFESNCQMVTNARLKMEKKIVWLQIKIKVRLFRSNAFPAESHQCTLHYQLCLLSGLRSGLHLLFMQSTDLHWPVKSHQWPLNYYCTLQAWTSLAFSALLINMVHLVHCCTHRNPHIKTEIIQLGN